MVKPGHFSIRSKILLVLGAVLVSAVGLYLYLASQLFFEDKKLLVFELNQTNVRTLGEEVETYFKRILDKLQVVASLHEKAPNTLPIVLPQLAADGEGILRVALIRDGRTRILGTWPKALELDGYDAAYLDRLRERLPIPIDRVLKTGVWIRNASFMTSDGDEPVAIVTVATRVGDGAVVYADLKLDYVLSAFSRGGIAQVYLMDSDGFALADSANAKPISPLELKKDALMAAALASKLRSEVRSFEDAGREYLGSFFKVGTAGLVVASKVEAGEAFAAARVLLRKSLLYGMIVLTAAFLISLLLSHSLTDPIRRLVAATERIAQGDFNLAVPVSTGDELALLANSFNSMTVDLRVSHEQIKEYSRDLEKKVADRTARLEQQNIAIKEAQEALVRTTRLASVGEVAGRAAHEVLNPLTNISNRLEKLHVQLKNEESQDLTLFKEIVEAWRKSLKEGGKAGLLDSLSAPSSAQPGKTLLEEDLDNLAAIAADSSKRGSARQGDLEFLMKESQRINKIVNGMRQLTRVTGVRKSLSAHKIVQEAVATMRDVLGKNKISIETEFCEGDPKVQADPDEMLQVFSNLIRNSMQALKEKGSPSSKIIFKTAIVGSGDLRKVHIRVTDNGPGIAPDHQAMIFEPTFTTKSIEEGTGLGLAICRRFVRAYEGEITLESSDPSETVFLIELPETSAIGGAA